MPVKTKKMIVLQARHIAIEYNVGITLTANIFKHMKDHYKEGPSMTKVSEKLCLGAAFVSETQLKSLGKKKNPHKYKWNLIEMNQRKKKEDQWNFD